MENIEQTTEEYIDGIFKVCEANGFAYEPIRKCLWAYSRIPVNDHMLCMNGMMITKNHKSFYFYPTNNKWRVKGKTKMYYSKGIEHLFSIINKPY